MKRFTETQKWDDPWFYRLSTPSKLLWSFLCDNCDNAGVIEFDLEIVSLRIREPVNEQNIAELGDRLQRLSNGKYHLPKFVRFQFGELKPTSIVHKSVLKLLLSHNLTYPIPCPSHAQSDTPSHAAWAKDKDKDKEDSEGCGERKDLPVELPPRFPASVDDAIARTSTLGCGPAFASSTYNLAVGRGGRDSKGVLIASWEHFVSAQWAYHKERNGQGSNGSKRSVMDEAEQSMKNL